MAVSGSGMSFWLLVKGVHVATVAVTLCLFLLRGWWALTGALYHRGAWVRIVPHVNDALLLSAGVTLAVLSHQYPLQQAWLTAKLAGLLLYIALGRLALGRGLSRNRRLLSLAAALSVFAYIVAVALTRSWLPGA